jgi:hypothetical protein
MPARHGTNWRSCAPLPALGSRPRPRDVIALEGRWGVVMERIDAPVLGAALSDKGKWQEVLALMLDLQRRIHAAHVPGLGPLKSRLAERIGRAAHLTEIVRQDLLARLAAMPDGDRVCHGDFQPFNILGRGDGARVVDWLDATSGAPAADVCRTYVLARTFSEELAASYVTAYAGASGMDDAAIYAWLPFVAAARLVENVPEEQPALLAMAMGDRPPAGT